MAYTKYKLTHHEKINIGDVFGKWTIIDNSIIRKKYGVFLVTARCVCGKIAEVYAGRLLSGNSNGCRTCITSGSSHYKWQGVGKMSASVLYGIKQNAKRKNRKVDLTLEYLWELFIKQNESCALSGVKLDSWISNNKKQGRRMSASLDRIDSNGDYVVGNVQWVHKDINKLKTDFSQEKFIELCKLVAIHNEV
jgi:hypothetical protein